MLVKNQRVSLKPTPPTYPPPPLPLRDKVPYKACPPLRAAIAAAKRKVAAEATAQSKGQAIAAAIAAAKAKEAARKAKEATPEAKEATPKAKEANTIAMEGAERERERESTGDPHGEDR